MKHGIKPLWLIPPAFIGLLVWLATKSAPVGIAVFAVLLMPAIISAYIPYAKDNPNRLWFKRKLYGWGWTPVTWQGWLVTIGYTALVTLFGLTIDERSTGREIMFTFVLPSILLTIAFMRIAYKKGESPRWQWGNRRD